MSCAITTVKIASIIFNILLAILSIGGIVCVSLDPDYFHDELSIGFYVTLSLCIAFACLGIFATIRESVCLTATCVAFLLILMVLNFAIAIIGISRGELNGVEVVQKTWEKDSLMDELQREHECCGRSSPNDYILINKPIPASCYLDQNHSQVHNLFTQGCIERMAKYYDEESVRFSIIFWSCLAFELFGFLLMLFMVINFRNTQRRMQF